MWITPYQCIKTTGIILGGVIGAAGGAAVAIWSSRDHFSICKLINNITGSSGHPVAAAANCVLVEACVGAAAGAPLGALAGSKLADQFARKILKLHAA